MLGRHPLDDLERSLRIQVREYLQNMLIARRNPSAAGREERLKAVIHPELHDALVSAGASNAVIRNLTRIEQGAMPFEWLHESRWLKPSRPNCGIGYLRGWAHVPEA